MVTEHITSNLRATFDSSSYREIVIVASVTLLQRTPSKITIHLCCGAQPSCMDGRNGVWIPQDPQNALNEVVIHSAVMIFSQIGLYLIMF